MLRGHESSVGSAVFDPSGTRVLTASSDYTARLWDAVSGAELFVLRSQHGMGAVFDPSGPRHQVMSRAVFDPSGARVLTASDDNIARLWDAASGGTRPSDYDAAEKDQEVPPPRSTISSARAIGERAGTSGRAPWRS